MARRGDEVIYVQVTLQVTGEETYEREFGNVKSSPYARLDSPYRAE